MRRGTRSKLSRAWSVPQGWGLARPGALDFLDRCHVPREDNTAVLLRRRGDSERWTQRWLSSCPQAKLATRSYVSTAEWLLAGSSFCND